MDVIRVYEYSKISRVAARLTKIFYKFIIPRKKGSIAMKYIKEFGEFYELDYDMMLEQMGCLFDSEVLSEPYYHEELQEWLPRGTYVFLVDGVKEPDEEDIMLEILDWQGVKIYDIDEVKEELQATKQEDKFYEFKRNIRIGQRF